MATNIPEGCDFSAIGGFKPIDSANPTCIHDDENPGRHCREVKCDDCPFRPSNPVKLRGRVLYLDLDGVLANFDKLANEVCGMDQYKFSFVYGDDVFWRRIHSYPSFFGSLELMPDALVLFAAVKHLNPVVLTALPYTNTDRVAAEKTQWVFEHLGKDTKVITCFTKDKPNYCQPGDVLVDDRAINQPAWRRKGGHYVIHTSAENSINQLINLGVL